METDVLAALIDEKAGVLAQLRDLARRQAQIVDHGDINQLLALLAAKQQLLNELQALEQRLDPFRSDDPDRRRWRSSAHRQKTREVAERCEALLNEIMVVEKQCESEMTRRRDDAAARLQGTHNVLQATTAYARAGASVPTQLDVTSES